LQSQIQQGSAEGSGEGSGRLWCRVRFNGIPEKVPGKSGRLRVPEKVSEKLWEAFVQSQINFNGFQRKLLKPNQNKFI
jgi:hypothetical protein